VGENGHTSSWGLDKGAVHGRRPQTTLLGVTPVEHAIPLSPADVPAQAEGTGAGSRTRQHGRLRAAVAWLEAQSLFLAAVAAFACVGLARIPENLNQDGWLALVGGRYVAAHGIPSTDTLNVMTHGARWIDQQWLAQWLLYRVDQAGGLVLYSTLYIALGVAAVVMAIAAARALGGDERTILWALLGAELFILAGSAAIRTQGFALPLFVAVLWLLARDVRAPSRRVYLVFPLLILWANLHGSVTAGVGLALLYGLTLLVDDVRGGGWRSIRRRTAVFLLAPVLCLLATPYGVTIVSYYRETLLNPTFSKLITEWRPISSYMVLAVPFFAVAFAMIWLLGRSGKRTPAFDQLALIGLAIGAVFGVRNVVWFGLGIAVLLPACIATAIPKRTTAPPRRRTINLWLAGVSLGIVAMFLIVVAVKPSAWFERDYSTRTLSTVESIIRQQPNARIFADVRFGDWLLWHDPRLAGKIAYDTRFELLSTQQLNGIADLGQAHQPSQLNVLAGYRVLVLDPRSGTTKPVLSEPGMRVVARTKRGIVALSSG
jgi:hypothetical protein